jgi:hypothetical protein
MADPETGNCIVFSGEIYNFHQLRLACERRGDRLHSDTDTEVILALYRRYGPSCLGQLRGMFAFAIWDFTGNRLFNCARSRRQEAAELCNNARQPRVLFGDLSAVATFRGIAGTGPRSA